MARVKYPPQGSYLPPLSLLGRHCPAPISISPINTWPDTHTLNISLDLPLTLDIGHHTLQSCLVYTLCGETSRQARNWSMKVSTLICFKPKKWIEFIFWRAGFFLLLAKQGMIIFFKYFFSILPLNYPLHISFIEARCTPHVHSQNDCFVPLYPFLSELVTGIF